MPEGLTTGFQSESGEIVLYVPAPGPVHLGLGKAEYKGYGIPSIQEKNGLHISPNLRNVALPPPYVHAGHMTSLADLMRHYEKAPGPSAGHTELKALALSESEVQDLAAFLGALTATNEPDPARH